MTLKPLVTAVVVIIAALSLPAKAEDVSVWVSGYGNKSCGEYIRAAETERKSTPANADPTVFYSREYSRYSDYLTGFLAGENMANAANGQDGEVGFSQNVDGMLAWLENYCRRNPTDEFITALLKLRKDLADKHR
jgi:hypothetical protein